MCNKPKYYVQYSVESVVVLRLRTMNEEAGGRSDTGGAADRGLLGGPGAQRRTLNYILHSMIVAWIRETWDREPG